MIEARPHPAKFSKEIQPVLRDIINNLEPSRVLDPNAGVNALGWDWLYCVEIEPEWAMQCGPRAVCADATRMPYRDGTFDAIVTSPTYATRMADLYDGRDGSKRHTYRIDLGRVPHENNTARMQWGHKYKRTNIAIIAECYRVLEDGGIMIVNISNHVRDFTLIPVTDWWVETMTAMGFRLWWEERVETRRQRHGANGSLRAEYESILVFTKV